MSEKNELTGCPADLCSNNYDGECLPEDRKNFKCLLECQDCGGSLRFNLSEIQVFCNNCDKKFSTHYHKGIVTVYNDDDEKIFVW